MEDDPEFLKKLKELAARNVKEGGGFSQRAAGSNIKQAAVTGSTNVKISQ